jgi:type II secretory ATPase GspE/PulE/Tfp pilus assembly ATPase PilB-like protein
MPSGTASAAAEFREPCLTAQPAEADIRQAAIAQGMTLMRDDGERLVSLGVPTREELARVTRD